MLSRSELLVFRDVPIAEAMGHNHRCGVLGKRGNHIGVEGSHCLELVVEWQSKSTKFLAVD